jgi:hypothetical protein
MGSTPSSLIFKTLHADSHGNVMDTELMHWLHDERYRCSEVFAKPEVRKQVDMFLHYLQSFHPKHIDVTGNHPVVVAPPTEEIRSVLVPKSAIEQFFTALPPKDLQSIADDLCRVEADERKQVIQKVFQAMDRKEAGFLTESDLEDWIKHEGVFQMSLDTTDKGAVEQRVNEVLQKMHKKKSGVITMADLENYFSTWTVREIMNVTYDLVTTFAVNNQIRQEKIQFILSQLTRGNDGVQPSNIHAWLDIELQFFRQNKRLMQILAPMVEEEK